MLLTKHDPPFGPQSMDNPEQTPVYVAAGGNSEPLPLDTGIQYLKDKLEHPEQYNHTRIGNNVIRHIRDEYES
jgi:hypothetical protein